MPFESKAQQRYLYAAEARGEVPKGTAKKKGEDTNYKRIPEKVRKEAALILDRLEKRASKAMRATLKKNVSRPHASERDSKHTTLSELPSRAGVLTSFADPTGVAPIANLVGVNIGAAHEGLRARKGKSEYHPTDRAKSVRKDMKTRKGRLRRASHVLPGVAGYQLGRDLVRGPQESAMYAKKGTEGDLKKKASAETAFILDGLEKRANQGTNTATRMVRKPGAPVSGKIPQPKQGSVAGPAKSFRPQNSSQQAG